MGTAALGNVAVTRSCAAGSLSAIALACCGRERGERTVGGGRGCGMRGGLLAEDNISEGGCNGVNA